MALSDDKQAILMFIATALITLNVYFATIPDMPVAVIVGMGAASALAVVAKEHFGAKKAEVAGSVATGGSP